MVWEGIPASLIIRYLEKGSERELADSVTKTGLVGEAYDVNSEKKTIENYTFVEDTGNTASTYSIESSITPIQVIFYYNLSNYGYRVEYYYDNVIDNDKTETKIKLGEKRKKSELLNENEDVKDKWIQKSFY